MMEHQICRTLLTYLYFYVIMLTWGWYPGDFVSTIWRSVIMFVDAKCAGYNLFLCYSANPTDVWKCNFAKYVVKGNRTQ